MRTDGLRRIVENVDRELSRYVARAGGGADAEALLTSWAALVEFLALGPAPDLQACPYCGSLGMRAATRCGTCWSSLLPPPSDASA